MFVLLNIIISTILGVIFLALFLGTLVDLGQEYGYTTSDTYGGVGYRRNWTLDAPPHVLSEALGPPGLIFLVVTTLYGLFMLIPTLAVAIRRLHDSNRTGWWAAAPYLINFLVLLISLASRLAGSARSLSGNQRAAELRLIRSCHHAARLHAASGHTRPEPVPARPEGPGRPAARCLSRLAAKGCCLRTAPLDWRFVPLWRNW